MLDSVVTGVYYTSGTHVLHNGMRRKQLKTAVFTVCLTVKELKAMKKEAERRCETPSDLMRGLLKQAVTQEGQDNGYYRTIFSPPFAEVGTVLD